jgi:hypothetical protein
MNEKIAELRNQARLQRAGIALTGLSVGDAFGETFFINPDVVENLIHSAKT